MKRIGRRLGEIIARYPPQPLTELRARVREIIAERPPQPLTWEHSGDLGKIIGVRIARLPLEQRTEVAQLTIIEVLMTGTDVELIGLVRRHVALELARLWTKKEWAEIERQREVKYIEGALSLAKQTRQTKAWEKVGKPKPESSPLQSVVKWLRSNKKRGLWTGRGIHSVAALAQYLKRWRAKKEPQP